MKRKYFFILILLFCFGGMNFFVSCTNDSEYVYLFSYFKGNGEDGLHLAYSLDGLTWKALNEEQSFLQPLVGKDKLMRDPCIVRDAGGTFHMVWTIGWWDSSIGYASSKDLRNWSEQQEIPVMKDFEGTKNCWAPELFYDHRDDTFYIFWSSTVAGAFPEIPTSEVERGLNHRLYYVTTKDFKTFSPTKLFFDPDFSVIDGAILKRGDTYGLFVKNENSVPAEKNLRITLNDVPYNFPVKVSESITGDYWAEGPSPIEIGEYVYVYFDKYNEGRYGAVRSLDMKRWEDVSDSVSFPSGVRHGTAFRVPASLLEKLKGL